MTAKYKKAVKGFRIRVTENGVSGSETYHRDDGGPVAGATLPTIGSTALVDVISGSTYANCKCTAYEADFPEGDETAASIKYEFVTKQTGGGGGWIGSTDSASRKFNAGISIVSRKAEGRFVWSSDGVACKDIDITKRVFNAQFTIPILISSASYNSYITSIVAACAGKINSSTFDGWPAGTVLFEGLSGGTKYNTAGNIQWAFDLNFSLKLISEISGGLMSWNHDWRGDIATNGGWDIPIDVIGSAAIYSSADLGDLISSATL